MANRPIFVSTGSCNEIIKELNVDFQWFPGMSIGQKQKSINSLHKSAELLGIHPILEISTKSNSILGVSLSAFNLNIKIGNDVVSTVESVYQGCKTFTSGGPYYDIFTKNSLEAKRDERLKSSGDLIGFRFFDIFWNLKPVTAFYDWVYISAINQNKEIATEILKYNAFTDIEFNPLKQVSCQARSAAIFVSLTKCKQLNSYLESNSKFIKLYNNLNKTNEETLFNLDYYD